MFGHVRKKHKRLPRQQRSALPVRQAHHGRKKKHPTYLQFYIQSDQATVVKTLPSHQTSPRPTYIKQDRNQPT